jgi:hypothetical protein
MAVFDFAPAKGKIRPAVFYSFFGAMSPSKKETAFLHLPTYIAGIIFHLGSFLSILILAYYVAVKKPGQFISNFVAGFLLISACTGIALFIKRMLNKNLRSLSNPDDYISNALVTLFQLATALALIVSWILPAWYIISVCLLLYFPAGKLKHAFYFFAVRYHLAVFFGRRGVWPLKPVKP